MMTQKMTPIRLVQSTIACRPEDITITPHRDAAIEQLGVVWDALQTDPHAEWFMSDWAPKTYVAFLQAMNHDRIGLMAQVNGLVAGMCWLGSMELHPETGKPLHCQVELLILPYYRGKAAIWIGRAFKRHILEVFEFQNFFCVVRQENQACRVMMRQWGMHRVGLVPKFLPVDGGLRDVWLYSAVKPGETHEGHEGASTRAACAMATSPISADPHGGHTTTPTRAAL